MSVKQASIPLRTKEQIVLDYLERSIKKLKEFVTTIRACQSTPATLRPPSLERVYLMHAADGTYKIGLSANPSIRAAQLTKSRRQQIKLLQEYPTPCPYQLETAAHRYYSPYRVETVPPSREWFRLHPIHVAEFWEALAVYLEPEVLSRAAANTEREMRDEQDRRERWLKSHPGLAPLSPANTPRHAHDLDYL